MPNMGNFLIAQIFIAFFALVSMQALKAEELGKFSLETGMDYNTGKYGGTQSTDIMYIPVTAKLQNKSWKLKLTVPYLQITGPGSLISVLNGVDITGVPLTNTPITRSGLGDVVAAATHNAYHDDSSGLSVNLTGKIKFGTASKIKGLGTGENDYALQSELYQVTNNLTVFGTLGYKVYGIPAGVAYKLNNVFFGSLGSSFKFSQVTNSGILLNLGQKTTATGSSHVEAIFFASHKIDKNWKARGYVLKGITRSVPNWGSGATVSYLF